MEERIQAILKERFGRDLDNCTKSEIFEVSSTRAWIKIPT